MVDQQGYPISEAPRDGTPIMVSVMRISGVPDTGHYEFRRMSHHQPEGGFNGWHPIGQDNHTTGDGSILAWWPDGTPESEMEKRPRTNWRYQPSNGTEGEFFQEEWCNRCQRDAAFRADPDSGDGCAILGCSIAFSIGDADYPDELIETPDGDTKCTAFLAIGDPEVPPRCTETDDLFEAKP